jgi:hypothetical protein
MVISCSNQNTFVFHLVSGISWAPPQDHQLAARQIPSQVKHLLSLFHMRQPSLLALCTSSRGCIGPGAPVSNRMHGRDLPSVRLLCCIMWPVRLPWRLVLMRCGDCASCQLPLSASAAVIANPSYMFSDAAQDGGTTSSFSILSSCSLHSHILQCNTRLGL